MLIFSHYDTMDLNTMFCFEEGFENCFLMSIIVPLLGYKPPFAERERATIHHAFAEP